MKSGKSCPNPPVAADELPPRGSKLSSPTLAPPLVGAVKAAGVAKKFPSCPFGTAVEAATGTRAGAGAGVNRLPPRRSGTGAGGAAGFTEEPLPTEELSASAAAAASLSLILIASLEPEVFLRSRLDCVMLQRQIGGGEREEWV